ncbi:Rab3 GTPase-activating protein catalytic subunit [Entomortierella parvispora]|uniref:Rab3 GTPase-activating protein catalytic subunit n=1 Tax=Entomortierella parvispora TaxID=205924 RepID=A0A9P3HAW9_9FUNG|nr:Rab3 GTPase-activating protein catalytic subunit [Entomortierella parvispora]
MDMDTDDFESFEFIDYTASGPWERFIVQIEDCLKQWGLVHNSFGVFNPNVMPSSSETSLDLDREIAQAIGDDHHRHAEPRAMGVRMDATPPSLSSNTAAGAGESKVYQHEETITLDDVSYQLCYRYHPAKARMASGVEHIDLEFLPLTLEGIQHHELHRWTSLTHILVLSPSSTSNKSGTSSSNNNNIIDLGTAKLLLSSFAIAFQNTGCNIPVFVPTGQAQSRTYNGLSIQPQTFQLQGTEFGLDETAEDQAIEVRYTTVLVPYPPAQYKNLSLSGILDLFIERMGVDHESILDSQDLEGEPGGYSHSVKEQIYLSALFTYQIENWYDEDWRYGTSESHRLPKRAVNAPPRLPIGPMQDPLICLQLVARFASAPSTMYLSNKTLTDMDATQANIWNIKATFKTDEYSLLCGALEDAISSWSMEVAAQVAVEESKRASTEKQRRSYTSLLRKGARLIQGSIAMVDNSDVESIVSTLFEGEPSRDTPAILNQRMSHVREIESSRRLISAAELGLHLPQATVVPYNSLLWRMLEHLVDVISPNSHITYPTSFMGFMKAVWADAVKQMEEHWRNRRMIPLIDVFGAPQESRPPADDSILNDPLIGDVDKQPKNASIDLRFNLIHQKLCMVNCCIVRELDAKKKKKKQKLAKDQHSKERKAQGVSLSDECSQTTLESEKMDAPSQEITQSVDESISHPISRPASPTPPLEEVIDLDKDADVAVEPKVDSQAQDADVSEPQTSETIDNGTLKDLQGLSLLETGAQLVVPQLQEPGIMTEDMIQEQELLFEDLGSTPDGAKTRAQLQSAHLVSDMQAFKAANPGCILGDFIRWHSPKDWDEVHKKMSPRMAESGNMWQTLWNAAEALPASQQPPLFDNKGEAEAALAFLKQLPADRLFAQLLPTLVLLSYDTLVSHPVAAINRQVVKGLQELAQDLTDFPWAHLISEGKELDVKPILERFRQVESTMGKVMALVRKFPDQFDLVERIVDGVESVVDDGPERTCVQDLFSVGGFLESTFPKPSCREFVMETFDPMASSTTLAAPASVSDLTVGTGAFISSGQSSGWHARPLQRRMYSCFKDSEVRIVEAIAKDGMFM